MPDFRPRNVPWQPGLLSANPEGRAAYLAHRGYTRDEIYADLVARAYPGTNAQLGKLASQAVRFRGVLDQWLRGEGNAPLRRQDIPRNAELTSRYRYIVEMTFRGGRPGERVEETRTVVVDSERNLGINELTAGQAFTVARELLIRYRGGTRVEQEEERWTPIRAEVISVERRT